MKTSIVIKNLKVSCILGVGGDERKIKQEVLITIKLLVDGAKAAKTDDIKDTPNYSQVYKQVIFHVENSNFHLLEALCEHIADLCLAFAKVEKVKVTVIKTKRLSRAEGVGVTIEKENE